MIDFVWLRYSISYITCSYDGMIIRGLWTICGMMDGKDFFFSRMMMKMNELELRKCFPKC